MGAVYRAHDPQLDRAIALKVLAADPGNSRAPERAARLLREARAGAALDHPNVTIVHDIGEHEGVPYIAMELVTGKNLREQVTDGPTSIHEIVRWLVAVARALAAAHDRGLVHRDVKPENVMLRNDGVVKVLDFGIARRSATAEGGQALGTITREGVVVGTPHYMAPEQLRNDALDGRADQFAWGVMAYELLSGRSPWGDADDGMQIVAAILSTEPLALDGVASGVGPELAAVVHRALAKDPAARFSSMHEVADALARSAPTENAPVEKAALASLAPTEMAPAEPSVPSVQKLALAPTEEAPAIVSPPPRRARFKALGAAVALAVVVASAIWITGARTASPSAATPIASASSSATTMIDLPAPTSSNPEALASYAAGVQALRSGSFQSGRTHFERAVSLEPAMAAAQLRLGAITFGRGDIAEARAAIERAQSLAATLSERDRVYLGIFEVLVMRAAPDWTTAAERVSAALVRFPRDAELWFTSGTVHAGRGNQKLAIADYEKAIDLDQEYGAALYYLGDSHWREGRVEAAQADFERCVAAVPKSLGCRIRGIVVAATRGDCERLKDAETILALSVVDVDAHELRAVYLAWTGAPLETVREALRPILALIARGKGYWGWTTEEALALWSGDFTAAESLAREHEDKLGTSSGFAIHAASTWVMAQALVESGRLREAGEVARAFLDRSKVWPLPAGGAGMAADPTWRMLALAKRAGAIDETQFVERRDAWSARWRDQGRSADEKAVLLLGLVGPAETPAEGATAKKRLADLMPLPMELRYDGNFIVAKAEFLANDLDSAIPALRRAAGACYVLDQPTDVARAQLMLGDALSARGDVSGACAAYGSVVERWGSAKPRSVSAEIAKKSMGRLPCKR